MDKITRLHTKLVIMEEKYPNIGEMITLINQYNTHIKNLTELHKQNGITSSEIEHNGSIHRISYDIKTRNALDRSKLPDDMLSSAMSSIDFWYISRSSEQIEHNEE